MHSLILDRRGLSLEYENRSMIIREPNQPPRSIPLSHIRKVVCLHGTQVSTSLLGQLWEQGCDFIVINNRYSDRSMGLYPHQQRQVERRCLQYQWQQDPQRTLPLAIQLCQHRIRNFLRLLPASGHEHLHQCMQQFQQTMGLCQSADELRGVEGAAQRMIFDYWRQQLPTRLGFFARKRRPPPDPVNALLSLTYSLVMQEAIRQCISMALDSQLGFYHRTAYGRHSLACDIMEPVRPAVEQWVMLAFINGVFDNRHFTRPKQPEDACLLGKQGRTLYWQAIDPCLTEWQRQLQVSARWIAHTLDRATRTNQHPPSS